MKALSILIFIIGQVIPLFAQLNETEHYTVNFDNQSNPKIRVTMYYYTVCYGQSQAYWITIQNLTSNKVAVKGKYFAILKCGNQSTTDINIEIKPNEKATPKSGYLADDTGLFGKAWRELCDIPPTYENGKKVWHSMIDKVGYQIFEVKDLETNNNQSSNNSYNQNSGGSNNSNSQNSNSNNQNNYQLEQQQQQEEQARRQQEIEEKRKALNEQLDAANQRTRVAFDNLNDGLSNILDAVLQNMFRNDIERENQQRQDKFRSLQQLVSSTNGTLSNCTQCYGQGYSTCSTCNGAGKKTCTYCYGKGTPTCTSCGGTGKYLGQTCFNCGGAGSKQCTICKGSGNSYCTLCHATGKDFCGYCSGTGQEFVEVNETSTQYVIDNGISTRVKPTSDNSKSYTLSNSSSSSIKQTNITSLMNSRAPDFEIRSMDGKNVSLNSLSPGKIVLIFWSSLNPESVNLFKSISKNYNELQSRGYVLVDIALEYSAYQWKKAIQENHLSGIHLCEFQGNESDVAIAYNVIEVPLIFFIENHLVISFGNNLEQLSLK